ncbi:hypothetical protein HNO53_12950 [Billgrantia antri]|uniref:Major capsid protein n=1 Tax=Halomonas sulfidivorans TaxID=2733488 RepID=A0ABX7WGK3_9GAMM|nr:P22 phage major capsid protein family protein [Halomonas sulfidivorans]QTP59544.1 hypothetical protein HNO53_12950 [Halomonas sulfidivorans]
MQNAIQLNYVGARYNDLTDIMLETISGQALQLFRKKTPILARVNTDTSEGASAVGETIKARLPIDLGDADVLAPGAESTETSFTQQTALVTLNRHIYKEFAMSLREFSTSQSRGVVPDAMQAAINSLAKDVNKQTLSLTAAVTATSGGAGSKYGTKSVTAAKFALDQLEVDPENRFLGLGPIAAQDLLNHTVNNGFDKNDPHYVSGQLGGMFGFDVFEDTSIVSVDGVAPEPNIAYHQSAFTVAFRNLEGADSNTGGAIVQNIVDPISGIPMRMTVWFNPKTSKHHWKFETLYGVAATRPNSAVIMLQED